MATIRPSIYVGLGGTGIKAVSQTKKMFEDAFGKGNIPDQIAFAAIDFDLAEDPNLPTPMGADFLSITSAGSPRTLYDVRKKQGDYQWMFPGNSRFLGSLISDGASQVRTYGRFLTEMVLSQIERRIMDCYTQVTNIQADMDVNVDKTGSVDVHIAMSLAGGTGCGSFLNIASMLRDKYQEKVKLVGYGVLHSVFRTMDPSTNKTPRVVANAYSAILDLDYLMGATADNPISLNINGKTTELKQPIFDEFFVVDNETENGKRVDNISKLCEVVGTCMYVAGSEMGSKIQSGQSNTHWKNGNFNISPKLGWAQGLGACQIVYKGALLAEIYALKAAIELIRKIQNSSAEMQQKAQNWTEREAIREDGDEYNLLIDSIFAPEKISKIKSVGLDVKDSIADIKVAVSRDIERLPLDFPEEKALRTKEIVEHLRIEIIEMLKDEYGVGNALVFLQSLNNFCEKYKGEMDKERLEKDKEAFALIEKLESKTYKEYQEYAEKLLAFKKNKRERLDVIEREVKKIKVLKAESKRRLYAYNIFVALLAEIDDIQTRVQAINNTLTSLTNSYSLELSSKQSSSESRLVFEYDLSYKERISMCLDPNDVIVSAFTQNVSLYDIDLTKDLGEAILKYAGSLNQAEVYRNKLIVDVINDLQEEDYMRLKKEITEKSSRLLKLNDRGQVSKTRGNQLPTSLLVQNYLISIYDKTKDDGETVKSRLEGDATFLRNIKKEYILSDFDSMKQKIIFYRADMAIIPYCIDAFDDLTVEHEYEVLLRDSMQAGSTGFNPHFDKLIFEEMRSKDFKLKPEMQNEAMFYWVCGNLFGWREVTDDMHMMEKNRDGEPIRCTGKEEVVQPKYIRVKNGKYLYWDEAGDPGKDQKWKPIDNTTVRNTAYNYFKTTIFPEIKTMLHNKIASEITDRGENYYVTKVQSMVNNGIHDYINCVVCSNKNSSTISSQNGGEWAQYLEEWKFIENDLINSIKNINS